MASGDDFWSKGLGDDEALALELYSIMQGNIFSAGPIFSDLNRCLTSLQFAVLGLVLLLFVTALAFRLTRPGNQTGSRLRLLMQTLEILHPVLLGWEDRLWKDDLLCTFVSQVCTGHLDCTFAVGAASAEVCRGQLVLTS